MKAVGSRTSSVLLALLVPVLVSCSAKVGGDGGSATTAAADTVATVEHGAYLVTILGCHDCHTPGFFYNAPDYNRALSGSELGWVGPWGTSYARNLTPDVETGIGSWTEDQIVLALQTGRRPNGTELLPPMPWPNFAGMKPRDIRSVAMYLKSIPPVRHQNLPQLPPGQKSPTPVVTFPPPPAWDVPKTP